MSKRIPGGTIKARVLTMVGRGYSVPQIHESVDSPSAVKAALQKLLEEGLIEHVDRGRYQAVKEEPAP
jgi:hypothetical protein